MKKGGGSESTIIIGPTKSVLVYALHSLEYVLGLAQFRVFVPNIYKWFKITASRTTVFDITKVVDILLFKWRNFFEVRTKYI